MKPLSLTSATVSLSRSTFLKVNCIGNEVAFELFINSRLDFRAVLQPNAKNKDLRATCREILFRANDSKCTDPLPSEVNQLTRFALNFF